MGVLGRSCIVAALTLVVLGVGAATPMAQDASAPELTAAYLVNFVRFTDWPAEALSDGAPIVICVVGNSWVADSLARLTRNRAVNGRTVTVRATAPDGLFDGCHVVYGTGLDRNRAERLIQTTANQPILTVSDAGDFAERGGVANFFVDGGKMRFAVNPGAAVRAGLHISSKLLNLARIVGH
jgi:hypothetical protein